MNKKIFIIAAGFGLLAAGCGKDHFDINQNPNNVTETSVTPDLTLAAQLTASSARNSGTYAFLNRWMGYWSASGSYSRASVEMSYNLTNDFGSGIWNGIYYTVNQYKSMEKKAADLDWKFYQGISKIMQAFEMSVLVDVYGNVPFSEAFDLAGKIRPKYDKDEDIYKALMTQIDDGLKLIKDAATDKNIATQDVVFKGNKTNWAKFANTLKLRLLIHCSQTSTFNVSTEIGKITSEGSGYLGYGVGAYTQPAYVGDKPNPFFNAHLFLLNGNEADNYNRANNYILDMQKALQDERHKRLFRECKALPGQYRGTTYGSLPNDDVNSDRTSGPGYGLVASAAVPMWILSRTEAMFLRAEAVTRGWIAGDSKQAYRDAVKESFEESGVPNASTAFATYLDNSSDPKVVWPDAGTTSQKISVVMWQKYFALCGVQPNETWVDVRRTGVVSPALSVAPERGSNPIPIRLLYPQSEYNFNAESVKAQGTISQFTSAIFWDK